MIIYKITNKITNKSYIGQTSKSLEQRISSHISTKNKNRYITNTIKKYGVENFEYIILCKCASKKQMDEQEKFYIWYYNTKHPFGYNFTIGGEGAKGKVVSEKSKEIMRQKAIGRKQSPETIEKRVSKLRGKSTGKRTVEQRMKMSMSHIGKKLSEEQKDKIRRSLKGRKHTKEQNEITSKAIKLWWQKRKNDKNL